MQIQKAVIDQIAATKRKVDMGYRVNYQGGQLVYNVNRSRVNIVEESGPHSSNSWFGDRTGQVQPPVLLAAVSVIEDTLLFNNGIYLKTCLDVVVES